MRPIPQWFQRELQTRSPRLRAAFLYYGVQTIVIPVAGTAFTRYVRVGERRVGHVALPVLARTPTDQGATVTFRFHHGPHPEHGSREFPAPPHGRSIGRVCILYAPRNGGREEVLVDLVDQDGELVEPDTRCLMLLAMNRDVWGRVDREDEEAVAKLEREGEARLEDQAREPFEHLFNRVAGIESTRPPDPAPQGELHPSGFRVIDRRTEKRSHLDG